MLDFNKLIQQIDQVGEESITDLLEEQELLDNARLAFDQAASHPEILAEKLKKNEHWVFWPVAQPLENFGTAYPIAPWKDAVTVVAVDGSQIMPSHHEVHACYLLNIGIAAVTYAAMRPPLLESLPHLYHRPEDLYPLVDRRRLHIDELYVSLERTLLELETLKARSIEMQERGVPVVALYDGSLIAWSAEKLPEGYQASFHQRMALALQGFQEMRIPLIGYLSYSRSSDIVNALRVSICPYEFSHCRELCGHLNEEDFPCSRIWPLSDRQLFSHRLDLQMRSCAFISSASAARLLPHEHRVCFCYLNIGQEIARLEFPRWLFDDQKLFQLSVSALLAQCQKGMGYPVCLSEAHHLAVIKGKDRERFFELISRHLVDLGVKGVRVSPKESKKRVGFV